MKQTSLRRVLVGVLAPAATTAAQPGILAGPLEYGGHTYYVLEASKWTEAEAEAVALGGHLVTINDAAENAWVFTTLSAFVVGTNGLWIGLNDAQTEGDFVWSSGEAVEFTNWNPGEPNGDEFENYVHMYPLGHNEAGLWNDNSNDQGWAPHGAVEVPSLCSPDCDASGVLDLFDFLCFVNLFNSGDLAADCDASNSLDLFDFLCFTNAFNGGC